MQNIFRYAPWFKELSLRISEMSQEELFAKAKQVDWGDGPPPRLLTYQYLGSGSIDPFSFIASLAHRMNRNERQYTFASAHSEFGVRADLPDFEEDEESVFPYAVRRGFIFHDSTPETMQVKEIWALFKQAVEGFGSVREKDFEAIHHWNKGTRSRETPYKLTSVLYLVNSDSFPVYPSMSNSFDITPREYKKTLSWEDYKDFVSKENKKFPGCAPYEMSRIKYWCYTDKEIDFASDFIIHGVRDDEEWQRIMDGRQFESRAQRDFNKGAIVLFHLQGSSKALGIGTVYGNGFGTMRIEEDKVNVLWLGKETRDIGTNEPSEDAFREAYGDTFGFIDRAKNRKRSSPMQVQDKPSKAYTASNTAKWPLNQILYGPPGTGKTYKARRIAAKIARGQIEDFQEMQREGQITMVTFHQSYSYEDFVEGIRPVLDEQSEDVKYTMKKGTFRVICDDAKDNPDANFVLLIDEINRGNIAKIFGELITLIEDSKRAGAKEALSVKLPYSGEELEVPQNLYIIGTMNTADRSIALLDTALRRRFTFVEMMPDYEHKDIPKGKGIDGVDCRRLLEAINERITEQLDREKQIGHTYLLNLESPEDLKSAFQHKICPLLSEYFYNDWGKIEKILGGTALVNGEQQQWTPSSESAWDAPESYIAIYKQNT